MPLPAKPNGPRTAIAVLVVLALVIAAMVALTKPSSGPPIVAAPPVGRLFFLMVNQASEHSTALRGLYMVSPTTKKPQFFLEEQENQSLGETPRQWISFPRVSPDGKYLAYLSTTYRITEQSQTAHAYLAIAPLAGRTKPKMLVDFGKAPAPVGLVWAPRTNRIAFLDHGRLVLIDAQTGKRDRRPLGAPTGAEYPSFVGPDATPAEVSYLASGKLLAAETTLGARKIASCKAYAASRNGLVAYVADSSSDELHAAGKTYRLQWSSPWYYKAQVTSLCWSPDSAYVGYTVSNSFVPEDSLYYLRLSDGKCFRLPYATSRAGWDWAR